MVTAAVGMRRRTRALGQRGGRLLRHGVGGPRVGAVSGCAGDYLAVVAVDHRRGMRLAVRRLGLGDVRQPPLVGTFGGEVPERSGCRERESSRPVRTAPATSGNMRHEPVPGHDPSDRLLRDAGSGRGLDPAAPVTAFGRGERGGHLRSGPDVTVIARESLRRGLDDAPPSCAAFLFLGGAVLAIRLDPMGHGTHAHAEPPGGLLLQHAARYRFDRLRTSGRYRLFVPR